MGKIRYRYRKIKGGKQRIAFKNNRVVEVKTIKDRRRKVRARKRAKKRRDPTHFDFSRSGWNPD